MKMKGALIPDPFTRPVRTMFPELFAGQMIFVAQRA